MKVLDLRCQHGHAFEGWFASEDDFLSQNGAQAIECPLCGDRVIVKALSAPRLNLGARSPQDAARAGASGDIVKAEDGASAPGMPAPQASPTPMPEAMQALWMKAVQHVLANTENVGSRFAEEARKIHYGEAEARGIRGQATRAEREALEDEGIEVAAIAMPAALKGPVQ